MSMAIRNKHFQVAFAGSLIVLGAGSYLLGKGEWRIWRGGMAGEGNMIKTRSRLPEKVVLSVAKILESAGLSLSFMGLPGSGRNVAGSLPNAGITAE